jgi:diguanylate cyclase
MINQLSYDELHSFSEQLEGMLSKHVNWLTLLNKTLVCKLPATKSLMRHHKECEFGHWYYSVTNPRMKVNPKFKQLGVIHKNLHEKASRLLDHYENNVITLEREYDLFIESENEFVDTLNYFMDDVLATKSHFDLLTNIPNRKLVALMLEKEYSILTRKNDGENYIVFADIDHFKQVNDNHGHATGDRVLTEVSKCFSAGIRLCDTLGRYGGEEFIFCFPRTNLNATKEILERLRSKTEKLSIPTDKPNTIEVTCSFGVSKMQSDIPLFESIEQADNAMYIAKKNGRNRIEVWSKATD